MRIYDYNFLETAAIPNDIVSFLVQIHEYKVRQANFYRQQPDVLSKLVEVAKIQSTGASNRIEGIHTTDQRLQELKDETRTIIIYEAPHHLVKTLEELYDTLGDRQISICRELTKRYEEKMRTTLSDSLVYYGENEPRGEYVLVIHGKTFEELAEEARKSWEDMSLEEHMQVYESQGTPRKEAMKLVAKDRGMSKRDVYQALLKEE